MSIKNVRESANMTQEEFGSKLGVKRSTVAMWESKKSYPRAEVLIKIMDLFNCTVDELLRDEDAPVPPTAAAV